MSRRPAGDAGVTLVELLIAMSLSTVVLAALGTILIGDLSTTSRVGAKVSTTADARIATDAMTRALRVAVRPTSTAPAVELAGDRSVTFYASLAGTATAAPTDPVPTKVTYRVATVVVGGASRTCLQQVLVPGSGTAPPYAYSDADARTTCLAYGAVNAGGTPLFTYASDAAGSATTSAPGAVRSVGIDLRLTGTSGSGSATTRATTRVSLANLLTGAAS